MRIALLGVFLTACIALNQAGIEGSVTIHVGVFGQLTQGSDDIAGTPQGAIADAKVRAYNEGTLVGTTATDAAGVYQLELSSGTYMLCTFNCSPDNGVSNCCELIDITDVRLRQDWQASSTGGSWCNGVCAD